MGWLGSVVVRALDLWSRGRRFDSWPLHCWIATLGKLFTPSVSKQYNLVPAKGRWCCAAGKVTVGLASHWPCVTDSAVYPPTGSKANVWEMSTLSTPQGMAHLPLPIWWIGEYLAVTSASICDSCGCRPIEFQIIILVNMCLMTHTTSHCFHIRRLWRSPRAALSQAEAARTTNSSHFHPVKYSILFWRKIMSLLCLMSIRTHSCSTSYLNQGCRSRF